MQHLIMMAMAAVIRGPLSIPQPTGRGWHPVAGGKPRLRENRSMGPREGVGECC